MTPKQIELVRHALGLTDGRRQSYRNYYVIGTDCASHAEWMAMVEAGYAARRPSEDRMFGGDDVFFLTRAGAAAALRPGEWLDTEGFFPDPASKGDAG